MIASQPLSPPDLTPETLSIQPLARAETIPSSWYVDPAFHAFDRERIFAGSWQYVGHEAQLPNPGDYLSAEVAGNPLVVVRGGDGVVRAFYNVCRHRGGPLVMDAGGCTKVLQCKYHGWTYRLDGSLRGVPRFNRTELFDKADYGLVAVTLQIWQGLLFVHLGGDPPPLAVILDGITERIGAIDLRAMRFFRRVPYDVDCNWKVYVDNYLEGYHIPLVHPDLLNVLDVRRYVTETHPTYSLQYSPFRQADAANPYGIEDGRAFYYFVFPNAMLNILPGRLQTNVVLPLAPARCRVLFDYFYTDVTTPEAIAKIEEDVAFSDQVQQEDAEICAYVQRGLQSRAYDRGRFSVEAEEGVYHFQCLLKEAYRTA